MVELEFVRTYEAPRQLVWEAWTDPEQLAKWWGPRGVSTPRESIEIDFRPGGRMSMVMVDDASGARYPNSGTIIEVDPPSRLVWTDDGFADGSGKGTTTVTLSESVPPRRRCACTSPPISSTKSAKAPRSAGAANSTG
jgi:uncharacterized protein YndB with AHSA1/START domain